jgi:hypothetical protein
MTLRKRWLPDGLQRATLLLLAICPRVVLSCRTAIWWMWHKSRGGRKGHLQEYHIQRGNLHARVNTAVIYTWGEETDQCGERR